MLVAAFLLGCLQGSFSQEDGAVYPAVEFRLSNGTSEENGRVEVYHAGEWGTICDDSFDIDDANFICNAMGYDGATEAYSSAYFGQGYGTIWVDDLACDASHTDINSCMTLPWGSHNCVHGEDAGVACNRPCDIDNCYEVHEGTHISYGQ